MIRDITIHAVLNGFVVTCGCQTVVFQTAKELCDMLENYLYNPDEIEANWLKISINAKHLGRPVEAAQCEERNVRVPQNAVGVGSGLTEIRSEDLQPSAPRRR